MVRRTARHTTAAPHTTTTRKPGLMARLRGATAPRRSTRAHPAAGHGHTTTTTTTRTTRTTHGAGPAVAAHHHKRRPTLGDKVSGALTRLRGSLTRRPGKKVSF